MYHIFKKKKRCRMDNEAKKEENRGELEVFRGKESFPTDRDGVLAIQPIITQMLLWNKLWNILPT